MNGSNTKCDVRTKAFAMFLIILAALFPLALLAQDNVPPYTNMFEVAAGTELVGSNGWSGSVATGATVVAESYSYTRYSKPLVGAHSTVVHIGGEFVTNSFNSPAANTNVFFSLMYKPTFLSTPPSDPTNSPVMVFGENGNLQCALYFNSGGQAVIYHSYYGYNTGIPQNPLTYNRDWTILTNTPVVAGEWTRIDLGFFYSLDSPFAPANYWGETFFKIAIDTGNKWLSHGETNWMTQLNRSYDDHPLFAPFVRPTIFRPPSGGYNGPQTGGEWWLCADSGSLANFYNTSQPGTYTGLVGAVAASYQFSNVVFTTEGRVDDMLVTFAPNHDVTDPVYMYASIDSNTHKQIVLHYNETLTDAGGDLINQVSVSTNNALTWTPVAAMPGSVSISGTNVVIDLSVALTSASNVVRVQGGNIGDLANNVIAGQQQTGLIDASSDITPPQYVGAILDPSYTMATLFFNEDVTNMVGTNIKDSIMLAPDGATYAALAGGDSAYFQGTNLVINLATPLFTALNKFKVLGGSVDDLATKQNLIAADFETATLDATADLSAPTYSSATIKQVASDTVITLYFSETLLNAGVTLWNETQLDEGSGFAVLGGSDTSVIQDNTLVVTIAGRILTTGNRIQLNGNSVMDASSNTLVAATTTAALDMGGSDDTAPTFIFADLSTNDHKVATLYFDEDVLAVGGVLATGVLIATDGVTYTNTLPADVIATSGNKVTVTFDAALTTPDNRITVVAGAIQDVSNNVLSTATTTAVGALDASKDIVRPAYLGGSFLDVTRTIWTLSFSETILDNTGGSLETALEIAFDGTTFVSLSGIGTAAISSGSNIVVTLYSALSSETNALRLADSGILDGGGNHNVISTTEDVDGRDLDAPVYQSANLGPAHKVVTLFFNENLFDNTGDLDNTIELGTNGSYSTIGANGSVTLSSNSMVVTMLSALFEPINTIRIPANSLMDTYGNLIDSPVTSAVLNASVNISNVMPYAQSFESFSAGESLIGREGFFSDSASNAMTRAEDPMYTNATYPITTTHNMVLDFQGRGVSNIFRDTASRTNIWVDFLLKPTTTSEQPHPALVTGSQLSMYINTNGSIVLWHGVYADPGTFSSASPTWTVLNNEPITNWVRVVLRINYMTDVVRSDKFFQISIHDNVPVSNALAWQVISPTLASETNGTWFLSADSGGGGGAAKFSSFVTMGPGSLDDLVVRESLGGYTAKGTPYSWIEGFYGPVVDHEAWDNADTDGDGNSTYAEFLAGTDPTDPESSFKIISVDDSTGTNIIIWTGGTNSGITAPFAVWRATDITNWTYYVPEPRSADGTNIWEEPGSPTPPVYYRISATNYPLW